MNVEIALDGMTWAELRRFVELGAHMADDEKVGIGYDADASFEPDALRVPLTDRTSPSSEQAAGTEPKESAE